MAAPGAAFSTFRSWSGAVIGWPSTVRSLSPAWNPAAAAGEPGTTLATLPGSSLSCVSPKAATRIMATRKLAAGPAARIRIRCQALVEAAAGACECAESALHRAHDAAERDFPPRESIHGLFVGGIEDSGMTAPRGRRFPGEPDARKALLVQRLELEAAELGERGRRHRVGQPVGIGQGDRDRQPRVGPAELRLEGAVDELDERVNAAPGMDGHRDGVQGDAKKVVRLDQLQALVHQSRGVDGDLWPH